MIFKPTTAIEEKNKISTENFFREERWKLDEMRLAQDKFDFEKERYKHELELKKLEMDKEERLAVKKMELEKEERFARMKLVFELQL